MLVIDRLFSETLIGWIGHAGAVLIGDTRPEADGRGHYSICAMTGYEHN